MIKVIHNSIFPQRYLYSAKALNTIKFSLGLQGNHFGIEVFENEHLLKEYYLELKHLIEQQKNGAWSNLTEEQKKELLLSYEESKDERNLIDHDEVMKKSKN